MSGPARAPAGLGPRGRAAWRAVTSVYDLRRDEAELLREWCRTLDVVEALGKALEGQPLVVTSPRDGVKAHPLLVERRQQQKLARELAAQLKLADVDEAYREPAAGPWSRRSHRRTAG